jgi:hypothetical protein
MVADDETTLVTTLEKPVLDGRLDEKFWSKISCGTVELEKDGSASFIAPSDSVLFFFFFDIPNKKK